MPKTHPALENLRPYLAFLPESIFQKLIQHLHKAITYEPVIGIMGKSGAGKSSLLNAIFESDICDTHPLQGCTRQAQRHTLKLGDRLMTLVDLPGVGETPEYDKSYRELYQQLLPELDLIIWILRADERAYATDVDVHRFLLTEGADSSRFLFVLSHADRVFPANEWCNDESAPSLQQQLSLASVSTRVSSLFPSSFPVLPVSAVTGWNLTRLVSLMIHALPAEATSAVFTHFRKETCSEQDRCRAKNDFRETIKDQIDEAIAASVLPRWLMQLLLNARQKIIDLTVSLWSKFF